MVQALRKTALECATLFHSAPPREYHVFLASYVSFCVLALLALSDGGQVNPFDALITKWAYGIPSLRTDWWKKLTTLGDGDLIRRGCGLGIILLMALRKWQYVPAFLIGVFGEIELNRELQKMIGRIRPDFPEIVRISSFGYPSGHTGLATAFYGFWIVFILREYRSKPFALPTILFLASTAVAVGFSRIFLLAHWATDVLGGFSFAIAWVLLCFWLNERMQAKITPARPVAS